MAEYQRKQLILGIHNRPSLEEEMKKYPVIDPSCHALHVTYNKEKECDMNNDGLASLSQLEEKSSETKIIDVQDALKIKFTLEILDNIKSF